MPPVISIVGASEVGKTTLIEKLIPELKRRGYRIGVVKHAHHGFHVDRQGKDSWRHKAAGADTVLVASPGKIAMIKDISSEGLEGLEQFFRDMNLVITEGYKKADKPKIEVLRQGVNIRPVCREDDLLYAVVSDVEIDIDVPQFRFAEVEKIVDFIEKKFLGS
jgi:molybdopterin-guanine dinucleotide biosynthesis protein B